MIIRPDCHQADGWGVIPLPFHPNQETRLEREYLSVLRCAGSERWQFHAGIYRLPDGQP